MVTVYTGASEYVRRGPLLALDGEACADVIVATLEKKASLRLQVTGFSMSPFIQDGDIVTLSPLPEGRVEIGRSIAFIRPSDNKLIIHRLIGFCKGPKESYLTKGDGAEQSDSPIFRTDMLAVVRKVERGGRTVLLGTGPERRAIAYMSRLKILWALSVLWKAVIPRSIRQQITKRLVF